MKNQIQSSAAIGGGIVLRFLALLLVCGGVVGLAQPTLTTIQDILYRADGTRFNGTVNIAWKPFQSGNSSFIPQQSLRIDVVNGVLRTKLVPTTNASPGANYEVTFSSQGRFLFTETWAVPPSGSTLKVRDVRVSSGTTVGNPPVFGQLSQIGDIQGLENELLLRPMRGFAFGPGRVAVINSTGQIDAAQGNLADCVHVDGSAGPCGSLVEAAPGFVDHEIPVGTINSSNATFTLAAAPVPASSLMLYRNGLLMRSGVDFTLSGPTITFTVQSVPQTGDGLLASYRTAASGSGSTGGPGGLAVATPEILCSGIGTAASQTTFTAIGTCVIPVGKLSVGDRIEVKFHFAHNGGTVPVQVGLLWNGQTVLNRTLVAVESILTGLADITVVSANAAEWLTESKGSLEQPMLTTGVSTGSTTGTVTLTLQALLGISSATENVRLRHYTVTKYPALAP
jgi:hypothetical protein